LRADQQKARDVGGGLIGFATSPDHHRFILRPWVWSETGKIARPPQRPLGQQLLCGLETPALALQRD
jgi:hypothetical protein